MPTEPRTATTINLAVARAAGIKCEKYDGDAGDDYVLRAMVDDPLSLKDWAVWNPTGDMNDAMEAAEKVGLFKVQRDSDGKPWRWRVMQGIADGTWLVAPMYVDGDGEVPDICDPRYFEEKPLPIKICEAIEAQERAEWLSQCLALGWSRELLDDMEALWQAYHKRDGSLMTAAEAREAKEESDAK